MEEKGKSSLTHFLYLKKNNQSNSEHNKTRNISCLNPPAQMPYGLPITGVERSRCRGGRYRVLRITI